MTVEMVTVGAERVLRFRDMHSGHAFQVTTPEADPELWRRYLAGAHRVYHRFGVESALEYESVADGRSTALFFAAVDQDGEVVAGLRAQGPYSGSAEAHGLSAWAGEPGEDALRAMIDERAREGIVEVKAVWVDRAAAHRSALGAAVARCVVHAAWLLGARWGFATSAGHGIDRYLSSGARIADEVAAVAYPDQRYRTVPLWWDTHAHSAYATRNQSALIVLERAALRAWGRTCPRPAVAEAVAGRPTAR
ncbi:hypothetical protein [Nocardia higoensis]|uniref:hypothetical protein n=1 Tax=Nocardia higoensis TaxID=228599 RepID=UPI0002FDCE40|nr:hypothetical protein [Nocardia higoensis]